MGRPQCSDARMAMSRRRKRKSKSRDPKYLKREGRLENKEELKRRIENEREHWKASRNTRKEERTIRLAHYEVLKSERQKQEEQDDTLTAGLRRSQKQMFLKQRQELLDAEAAFREEASNRNSFLLTSPEVLVREDKLVPYPSIVGAYIIKMYSDDQTTNINMT